MSAPNDETPKPGGAEGSQGKNTGARESTPPTHFLGTDNPRQLRAIDALLRRPTPREQLDSLTGSSNSPEVVAELRRRGLDIPCERITFIDRDGKVCHPGVYDFTSTDRRKVYRWFSKRKQGGAL